MDRRYFLRWAREFWIGLALLAVLLAGLRLTALFQNGAYGYTSGCEEFNLYSLSRIRHGEPAYVDCFSYPYRTSLYNWLFYRFYSAAVAAVNPAEETMPTVLRLVTLGWAILGVLASYLYLRRCSQTLPDPTPAPGLLAVAVALVTWFGPNLGWWVMTTRADVAAVCCAFLGLTLMARPGPRVGIGSALLAGVLFWAAWSFKQSEVAILLGTLIALGWRREWTAIAGVVGPFVVLTGLVLLTADEAYVNNVLVLPRFSGLRPHQSYTVLLRSLYDWGFLLLAGPAVAVFALSAADRRHLFRSRPAFILTVVFVVTLGLSFLGTLRHGAWKNYYFAPWVVGLTLVGLLYQHAAATFAAFPGRAARAGFLALTILLLFAAAGYTALALSLRYEDSFTAHRSLVEVDGVRLPGKPYPPELLAEFRASTRPIFCEDPRLAQYALGADCGQVAVPETFIYWQSRDAGRIRDGGIAERLRSHWFATVWLIADEVNPWEEQVKEAGYVLHARQGELREYVRPTTHPSAPAVSP